MPSSRTSCFAKRIFKLRETLADLSLDAALITSPANVFYLSGFTGYGDGKLFITQEDAAIITDFRYEIQAAEQCPDYQVEIINSLRDEAFVSLFRKANVQAVGIEDGDLSYRQFLQYAERLDFCRLISMKDTVDLLRVVKDTTEIAIIAEACKIASDALRETLPYIRPGTAELDIACELEYRMRKLGASGPSFDTIVASGKRSAMPHGVASDKKIENSDPITIDFGACYKGYCSDMTRTFFVGQPSREMLKIYEIVRQAQQAALSSYQEGMPAAQLDYIARSCIAEQGYGNAFGHSLGHGVGVKIHEAPTVSSSSVFVLEQNMVFSVEPGIYVEALGGVRIEDLVTAGKGGLEILTDFSKDAIIL